MAVLELTNVTKIYKPLIGNKPPITAVDDVSFSVNAGEVVGFIGPNGAGKSTAIKMITGLATQTQGTITINGFDTVKKRVESIRNVGAIIENPDMYLDWSGYENLQYFANLQESLSGDGIRSGKEVRTERVEEVLRIVGLSDRQKDKVKKYSLGMKQRLGIAQALLNNPQLLILDEPANGLDPAGIREIREIVRHLAKTYNMAILVSSHQLAEMQLMCDRFLIIHHGKIIKSLTAEDLHSDNEGNTIVIATDDIVKARDIIKERFGLDCVLSDGRVEIRTDRAVSEITKELILSGVQIFGVTQKEVSLEEMFMRLTGVGGVPPSQKSVFPHYTEPQQEKNPFLTSNDKKEGDDVL